MLAEKVMVFIYHTSWLCVQTGSYLAKGPGQQNADLVGSAVEGEGPTTATVSVKAGT